MTEKQRSEKKEEKGEKEEEKKREKDEKWRRDRVSAVGWALILIWGALIILAETTNFADKSLGDWWEGWSVFFAGAGAIVILGVIFRLLVPEHRRPIAGSLILGFVFLGIGLGELVGWDYIWVVILFAIAAVILLRAFVPRN